jgi:hypothetical protein
VHLSPIGEVLEVVPVRVSTAEDPDPVHGLLQLRARVVRSEDDRPDPVIGKSPAEEVEVLRVGVTRETGIEMRDYEES